MRKLSYSILLWFAFLAATAQSTEYTDGVFMLNEDWFGHNNSTINFINPSNGEFDYLILQGNTDNAGVSLGCTAQYGTIYGDNIYIMSKQDQDDGQGDDVLGGRIIVADAKTMKVKKRIPVIYEIDGKTAADGRGFVGVDEEKGYVGTSNGIFIFNLSNFEIGERIPGTENPLITGDESNADGLGGLYNNQIGMMCRTSDYVFAIQQDRGVLVIDPVADTIVSVIEGCYSTLTQSKDGTVWVGKNSNMDYQSYPYGTSGEYWDGDQLLKINPYTLATETIDMRNGAGVNQTWYAWTAGSLCASTKENKLYFAFNDNDWNWFTTSKMYCYDIDNDEFTLIYDSENEERYFYGASLRINPLDDKIYAALYLDNIDQTYFIYQLDQTGELLQTFEPIKRYWFPALFIFPDNNAPVVSGFSEVTLNNTQPVYVGLSGMASDEDNLAAAITKSIISNDNENILSANIKNDTLTLAAKSGATGTAKITIRFNSNGKTVDKVQQVTVSTVAGDDQVPPTSPSDLAASPSETSIALYWTASTDNVGVAGYVVYLDGDSVGITKGLTYTVDGLSPATEYILAVAAFDAAGNKSAKSSVTVSTKEATDTVAPTIPANLSAGPCETSIALSWAASTDNVGVAGYVIYLGGDSVGITTGVTYTVDGLSPATEYILAVAAFDAAGNKSAKSSVTVSTKEATDTVAPTIPANLSAEPCETSIALSWTASTDNVGVAGYVIYLGGDSVGITTGVTYTVDGLSPATEYILAVAAFDAAGNKSAKSSVTVSTKEATDTVAPTVPANLSAEPCETSIALSWAASTDNVGVAGYVVYLDGDSIDTVTETTYTFMGLSINTEYTFDVIAFDGAGNSSEKATVTRSTLVTGIGSLDETELKIYPNPFVSFIIIEASTDEEAIIYDVTGKELMRINIGSGKNKIETSGMQKGIYLLKYGTETYKIIK